MQTDVDAYLARIGLQNRPSLDLGGLEILQRAHLSAVPFENLDVYAQRGVRTDVKWSVHKVVELRRGGWCFEINGAFSDLLARLGFDVQRLLATVLLPPASSIPSHLTLEVMLDRPYLVDVGFGDSFMKPLVLDTDEIQDGGAEAFVVEAVDGVSTLSTVGPDGGRTPLYRFDRTPHVMDDYTQHSDRLQTDPATKWRQAPFATRLIAGGPDRVTLLKDRLKVRKDGQWTERSVSEADWDAELDRWFEMEP